MCIKLTMWIGGNMYIMLVIFSIHSFVCHLAKVTLEGQVSRLLQIFHILCRIS